MKKHTFILTVLIMLTISANAQWQQTYGPCGGMLTCIAINGNYLYTGTNGGGVFMSSNSGTSWTPINNGITNLWIQAIAVNGDTLFAGTSTGVFFSSDNGQNWTSVNSWLTNTNVQSLAVTGTNVLAGTNGGGVFLSTNNGTSWTDVNTGISTNGYNVWKLAVSGSNIYAGTSYGLYLSTNNGSNWSYINYSSIDAVENMYVNGNTIYVAEYGIFKSTNGGLNWSSVSSGIPFMTEVVAIAFNGNDVFASTNNGGGSYSLYYSSNGGSHWDTLSTGLNKNLIQAMTTNGNNLYLGTAGAGLVHSTNNGVSWDKLNAGLSNTNIEAFAINGNTVYAGGYGGVFKTTNGGNNWTELDTGLNNTYLYGHETSGLAICGTSIFATTNNGGVFISTDNGNHWSTVNTGITGYIMHCLGVDGSNIFAGGDQGLYLSTNNGNSWTVIGNGLAPVYTIYIDSSYIYLGTSYGPRISNNSGGTWSAISSLFNHTNFYAFTKLGNNIYAGAASGVYVTTDYGTTWTASSNGITTSDVRALAVSGNTLYAGTYGGGVFMSTDYGNNWYGVNSGLINHNVEALDTCGSFLYAGTRSSGVWKIGLLPNCSTGTIAVSATPSNVCMGTQSTLAQTGGILGTGATWIWYSGSCGGTYVTSGNSPVLIPAVTDTYYVRAEGNCNTTGCVSGFITVVTPTAGNICYAECDSTTGKNKITWSSTIPLNIDSIKIYKEVSLNVWAFIGAVDASHSFFIDTSSHPAVQSYSYHITAVDTCGNESDTSSAHTTITLLATYNSGTNTYGFTWSKYIGLPVSNYILYGVTASGTSNIIGSVPGNLNYYNYIYPSSAYVNYFVGFIAPVCNTFKSTHLVRSNKISSVITGIENIATVPFHLYPNPANDKVTIEIQELNLIKNSTISIYNIVGQKILEQMILQEKTEIDISGFAKGIYILKFVNKDRIDVNKFVKE